MVLILFREISMAQKQRSQRILNTLIADERGNFAIMAAICLPILLGVGGAAIEVARAMQIKADMQQVSDAAVLSATTKARLALQEVKEKELEDAANDSIAASGFIKDLPPTEQEEFFKGISISAAKTKTDKGEEFEVRSDISYTIKLNPLLSFIGHEHLTVSVSSKSKSSVNQGAALSLYLVLDRSGSMSFITDAKDTSRNICPNYTDKNWGSSEYAVMSSPCYINKITSLKMAVNMLTTTLQASDPSFDVGSTTQSQLIRTAAVAYNASAFAGQPMAWGTSLSLNYVNAIPSYPTGGTDAVSALTKAVNDLRKSNTSESNAHSKAGNTSFERFIVFMTDGKMTGESANWNSGIDDSVRQICATAKKDGITIFSVAFMAPSEGQNLLKACASSNTHYYAPEKMTDLVSAFGDIARKASSKLSTMTN